MGKHRPGEGMTPVADLISVPRGEEPEADIEWPTGATEEYAAELHAMNAKPIVNEEARA